MPLMSVPPPVKLEKTVSARLMSVDALRGFDMFWLIGGYGILQALVAWINWPPLTAAAQREMHHPVWSGFQQIREMVRGAGLEPATPTVSR